SVDLCAFGALVDLFLDMPWAALRNPVPVPKTCPQTVRFLENASWVRWCGGELHRDLGAAAGPGGGGEGSGGCLGDALDDCQAEADACVVGAYAFGAAKKRLGKRGD